MGYGHLISEGSESLLETQCNRHGSMTPTGTSDADIEVAPLILLKQRYQKDKETLQLFEELAGSRIPKYILLHSAIFAGQRL